MKFSFNIKHDLIECLQLFPAEVENSPWGGAGSCLGWAAESVTGRESWVDITIIKVILNFPKFERKGLIGIIKEASR